LVILFTNKINSNISSSTNTFADDPKLYRKMASHTEKVIIQEDVDNLTENLKNLGLKFKSSKKKVIQISKRKETSPQLTIKSLIYKSYGLAIKADQLTSRIMCACY
jgi:hypothetical protein